MSPLNENAFCIAGHLLGKCIGHNNNINNNSKNKNNWVAVDLDGMALMGRHYYMPRWRVWDVIRKIALSDNIISTHTIYTYIYGIACFISGWWIGKLPLRWIGARMQSVNNYSNNDAILPMQHLKQVKILKLKYVSLPKVSLIIWKLNLHLSIFHSRKSQAGILILTSFRKYCEIFPTRSELLVWVHSPTEFNFGASPKCIVGPFLHN